MATPGLITIGTLEPPLRVRCTADAGPLVFAVVDGMGGHRGGMRASRVVAEYLVGSPPASADDLLQGANRLLYEEMRRSPELSGMGATVAGVIIHDREAEVFNVGDARAYHYSGGYLTLVTTDDRAPGTSGAVTQSLGGTEQPVALEPHITRFALNADDRLMLCSDGLTDVVPFDSIQSAVRERDPQEVAASLLEASLAAGAPDNVSILVMRVDGNSSGSDPLQQAHADMEPGKRPYPSQDRSSDMKAQRNSAPSQSTSPQEAQNKTGIIRLPPVSGGSIDHAE